MSLSLTLCPESIFIIVQVRTPGVMEEELPQTPAPHSSKRRGRQAAKQTEVVVKVREQNTHTCGMNMYIHMGNAGIENELPIT